MCACVCGRVITCKDKGGVTTLSSVTHTRDTYFVRLLDALVAQGQGLPLPVIVAID